MRVRPLAHLVTNEVWNKYLQVNYFEPKNFKPIKQQYKVSICTTCMDRLDHLKQTYIQNIEDNLDYPNIEFVLLNYGSKVDDVDTWVKESLSSYIDKGIVNYYKTTEPKHYSMTHSRNIAFKLAAGDIVNNVDADHFTNKGFVTHINLLANQVRHPIFVKSHQKNRGRLGLFKKDFLYLGGYDEQIRDYGFDDKDLVHRAVATGFKIIKFTGEYFTLVANHTRHFEANYYNKDWRYTQDRNALLSLFNISIGKFIANQNQEWGKTLVTKNLKDEKLNSCEFA